MGLPTANITLLVDLLADMGRFMKERLSADGVICEDDHAALQMALDAKHGAMRANLNRLKTISQLNTGEVNDHLLKQEERLEAQIADENAALRAESLEVLELHQGPAPAQLPAEIR